MLKSMTGFGTATINSSQCVISIKSLNSKSLDITTRIPLLLREKDIEIRNLIAEKLERGKIDFSIIIKGSIGQNTSVIDINAVRNYYKQLNDIAKELSIEMPKDWISTLIRMPDVIQISDVLISNDEWIEILRTIEIAIDELQEHRTAEGKVLLSDVQGRINKISFLLEKTEAIAPEREQNIRNRLLKELENIINKIDFDKNRFEQEILYYLEKQDISEELTRTKYHCDYFTEILNNKDTSKGKKLLFLSQELLREINTLSVKSAHFEIQKLSINIKEEIEKIKEQLANVL